jgi:cytochrome c oxidase subunit III
MNSTKSTWTEQIERMHPYHLMLYLSIFSSVLIFSFLIGSFIQSAETTGNMGLEMPVYFYVSLGVAIACSLLSLPMKTWFEKENLPALMYVLSGLSAALVLFMLLQYFGWRALANQGVYFTGRASQGYIYVVTGAHALHVIGGLLMVLFAYKRIHKSAQDPVSKFIYFTDEFERMRISLVVRYLHFLDLVWLILFILLFILHS